jgi:hypothetical protein
MFFGGRTKCFYTHLVLRSTGVDGKLLCKKNYVQYHLCLNVIAKIWNKTRLLDQISSVYCEQKKVEKELQDKKISVKNVS